MELRNRCWLLIAIYMLSYLAHDCEARTRYKTGNHPKRCLDCEKRSRYKVGNHPKRANDVDSLEDDLVMDSKRTGAQEPDGLQLDKIGEILGDLSAVLNSLSIKLKAKYNQSSNTQSQGTQTENNQSQSSKSQGKQTENIQSQTTIAANEGAQNSNGLAADSTGSSGGDDSSGKNTNSQDKVLKALEQRLVAALSKKKESETANPSPKARSVEDIIDPKPRSQTDDEDDKKFKRVLTKWMERELAQEG